MTPEQLLFGTVPVDDAWVAAFRSGFETQPGWIAACETAVASRYAQDASAGDGYGRVAFGLVRMGRDGEALAFFRRDFASGRMRRWQFMRFVDALECAGCSVEAERIVMNYYGANPRARDGWSRLAWAAQVRRDWSRARELYERDFNDGRISPEMQAWYAFVLARAGEWERAEPLAKAAVAADPSRRDALGHLASLRAAAREWSQADRLFSEGAAYGKLSAKLMLLWAETKAHLGAWDDAESTVNAAYAADGRARDGFSRLATIARPDRVLSALLPLFRRDHDSGRQSPEARHSFLSVHREELRRAFRTSELASALIAGKWVSDAVAHEILEAAVHGELREMRYTEFIRRWLIRDGRLCLRHAELDVGDQLSLETLLDEILVFECYYFATDNPEPRIIDAGANFGLTSLYLSRLYPKSSITAYEPDPHMGSIIRGNIQRNGWTQVRLVEAAVAGATERRTFRVTPEQTMAGSLTDRMVARGAGFHVCEVQCLGLVDVIGDRPVDFLKLDIEGAEREALESARAVLPLVRNLFCEVHRTPGASYSDLIAIIQCLEESGFQVEISGPSRLMPGGERGTENIRLARSHQLWATRPR